jgi:hypothetical protein
MEMLLPDEIVFERKIRTRKTEVALRSDGIMQYELKVAADFSIEDLKEVNEAAGIIGQGKAYPNLIFISQFLNAEADFRNYAAGEESNRFTKADAFVVNSVALKLIGNFYIRFNKPLRPTRIFTSAKEATSWLYTFL